MKLKNVILLLWLFFSIAIFSCKKDKKDNIQPLSNSALLMRTWDVVLFKENGVDLTDSLKNISCYMEIIFTEDDDNSILQGNHNIISCFIAGSWEFRNNELDLLINFYNVGGFTGIGPIGMGKWAQWKIDKLTEQDLWLNTNYNSISYSVKLKAL